MLFVKQIHTICGWICRRKDGRPTNAGCRIQSMRKMLVYSHKKIICFSFFFLSLNYASEDFLFLTLLSAVMLHREHTLVSGVGFIYCAAFIYSLGLCVICERLSLSLSTRLSLTLVSLLL